MAGAVGTLVGSIGVGATGTAVHCGAGVTAGTEVGLSIVGVREAGAVAGAGSV
jgi:hypothetical protein